jgi:hypothetical protein
VVFVNEYMKHFNAAKAARSVGLKSSPDRVGYKYLGRAEVQALIEQKVKERNEQSDLDDQYIRQYMKDVLDVCPTDYFTLNAQGEWVIAPEQFKLVPQSVRRLVENIESRFDRHGIHFKVTFISKTTVLAMAAKYTLTERHSIVSTTLPWDEIVRQAEAGGTDLIEGVIKQLEDQRTNGVAPTNGLAEHAAPG